MKTVSSALGTHLEGEVTTLATCWKVTRTDGVEFYFTDHDRDITFDGDVYKADSGYRRSAVANDASLAVDNLDIEGVFDDDDIKEEELRAGLFNYAEIEIFLVNWRDLSQGQMKMRKGNLGEVTLTTQGIFRAELRGLTQRLSQNIGELYQPECRADVGDSRCKVPIQPELRNNDTGYSVGDMVRVATDTGATGQAQYENRIYECTTAGTSNSSEPTFDTTVGNTTSDGTVTWTAREAWQRHGVVDTVTDRRTFTLTVGFDESRAVDDWFNSGVLAFDNGDNAGFVVEIRDWVQSTRTVTVFLPAPYDVTAGDLVRLYPGCDKRRVTCATKWAISGSNDFPSSRGNIWNFRGENAVPGQDELTSYPDAKSG